MIARMKRFAVYLTLMLLLAVSIAAGWVAADWPRWCRQAQWCDQSFPR